MRKVFAMIGVVGVEAVGSVVLETTILPNLFKPPYLFILFGILVVTVVALWMPEIRVWLNREDRIIRRGRARAEKDHEAQLRARIGGARKTGILWNITYNPTTDRISGDLFRRSWKGHWVGYATWLMNRRMVNRRKRLRSIFYWFLKRLEYTMREAREKEMEDELSR